MPEQSTRLSPDRSTGIPWPHDGAPAVPVVPAASTAVEVDFTPHNPIACAFRGEGFPGFPSQLGAPPLGQYWRSPDNTRQHQEMLMHHDPNAAAHTQGRQRQFQREGYAGGCIVAVKVANVRKLAVALAGFKLQLPTAASKFPSDFRVVKAAMLSSPMSAVTNK